MKSDTGIRTHTGRNRVFAKLFFWNITLQFKWQVRVKKWNIILQLKWNILLEYSLAIILEYFVCNLEGK